MQANVNLITAAARATNLFRAVVDDVPHEWGDNDFPNLAIYGRRILEVRPVTVDLKRYDVKWEYDVIVEDLYSCGHAAVENEVLRFLIQLQGSTSDPWFEIVNGIEIREGHHAQRQIIGAEITLRIETAYDLEIVA